MDRLVFTPWRDHNEILTVRRWFYPAKGSKDPDMRRKACSQVMAWKLRGNLPHAVESTWLLIDAILSDNTKVNKLSPFAVRACYSTAFCRFVTGLVDSEQDSRYKVSMYAKAQQIALPTSFVELRHESTHGGLPSLVVFRRAAERSLEWLWQDYWKHLDVRTGNLDEHELDAFKEGCEKLKENFRVILRTHLDDSLQAVKGNSRKDMPVPRHATDKACLELVKICKNDQLVVAELVKVFLEYKMLIPTSKILGHHMDEVFPLWDSLLKRMTSHQSRFLSMLTDEMLILLISPSTLDITLDPYREAITLWLEHIYTTREWNSATKRGKADDKVVISTCLQNQNHWTIRLAAAVIEDPSHKLAKEVYGDRVAEATKALEAKSRTPIVRSISIENLDRLLPSQRQWLQTQEGEKEKARYLKRVRTSNEQTTPAGEEQSSNPHINPSEHPSGSKQTQQANATQGKNSEDDSESDAEIGGWSKWEGVWIAKPIGMV